MKNTYIDPLTFLFTFFYEKVGKIDLFNTLVEGIILMAEINLFIKSSFQKQVESRKSIRIRLEQDQLTWFENLIPEHQ